MAKLEITVSDQNHGEIESLVEQDEFLNWEQAIEELISMGLSSHNTEGTTEDVAPGEDVFNTANDEQRDPARRDDSPGDERTL